MVRFKQTYTETFVRQRASLNLLSAAFFFSDLFHTANEGGSFKRRYLLSRFTLCGSEREFARSAELAEILALRPLGAFRGYRLGLSWRTDPDACSPSIVRGAETSPSAR